MLSQLTISNYAIVEQLDLELRSGMTVITGETGAGKSIMLDALALTLGDRADKEVIQPGQDKTEICANFEIANNKHALRWLDEQDYATDDECILRRVVTAEGRSKAYINGRPVTLSELKQLGEMLVDIHSQHEHQSLLKTSTHQRLLDDYCGTAELARKVAEASHAWLVQHKKLQALENQAEEHNALFELQHYQLKELNELNLAVDEYPTIEDEHQQLNHAESILSALQSAIDICKDNDEQNIQAALAQAQSLLENMPYRSASMQSAYELLSTALIQVEEASNELIQAADSLDMNPTRLQELDERLSVIHQLARKHKVKPEDLPAFHQQLQNDVGGASSADEQIAELKKELKELETSYQTLADELSKKRKSGALKLSKAINVQLKKLDMDSASFTVAMNNDGNNIPRAKGNENIEFLISTNPGQSPKPLIKIASGESFLALVWQFRSSPHKLHRFLH